MKKRIFSIVMVIALISSLVVFSGCGKKKENNVIKIGAIIPLTGPASTFGQYIKEGVDLAIEKLSSESHTNFSIIYEDSQNKPKVAVSAFNKIIETENPLIIITALSSVADALTPLAKKNDIILLLVDVAKPNVADGINTFRIYPEANGTAGVIADFATSELNAKNSAVFYINDAYGKSSLDVFKKRFEIGDNKVVFDETYNFIQKDFRDIISKLKNVRPKPDVIYLNGYGPSFVKAIRQLKEMNVGIQIIADVALGLPENYKQAGDASEGAYFVDGKIALDFVNKFKQKYGKEPSSDAGYAYDSMMIIDNIMKTTKSYNVNSLRNKFVNLKNFSGVMGNITMKKNGDADLDFVINQIKNGKPILIQK